MIVFDPELLAKIKSKLEQGVTISPWFKTLISGLKREHAGNVGYVYPLLFILRRICFVAAIVLLVEQSVLGLLTFVALSIVVLAYSLNSRQWADPWSNRQHTFNEVMTYLIGTLFLISRVGLNVKSATHEAFDLVIVALLGLFVTGNGLVMVFAGLNACKLSLTCAYNRSIGKKRRTKTKRAIHTSISRVVYTIQHNSTEQKLSLINLEDCEEQQDAFVKVTVSRTSWW